MPQATYVPITDSVLEWAMEEAGVTDADVAKRCKVTLDEVAEWRGGTLHPTKTQFAQLRAFLRRPIAFFFLADPPTSSAIPTAFRHPPGDDETRQLQRTESSSIRTARRLQKVSRWILDKDGAPEPLLPQVSLGDDVAAAAEYARRQLRWSTEEQCRQKDPATFVRLFRSRLESWGILVLHLPLTRMGCRGFSLYDDHAPVIAVNTAYRASARAYSYGHELAHLLLKSDGICGTPPLEGSGIERWCEEFSGAFLMPERDLKILLARLGAPISFAVVKRVASHFNVSLRAAALELVRLNLAGWDLYREVDEQAELTAKRGGGGGETSPEKRLREWGATYPRLLLDAERQQYITRQDVLEYLNLSNTQLQFVERELGVSRPSGS